MVSFHNLFLLHNYFSHFCPKVISLAKLSFLVIKYNFSQMECLIHLVNSSGICILQNFFFVKHGCGLYFGGLARATIETFYY